MSIVIDTRDLHKTYRLGEVELHVLKGVSLAVEEGEFVAIMGPSGSGKSTLMNILGCLDRPTRGTYMLMGRDVSRLDADALAAIRNKTIGFVFQNFNLLPRLTALENVELPLIYADTRADVRSRLARESLARVGLEGYEHHLPTQLSGGEQQRVAIARAVVNSPSLILADEPTGNLDTKTSEEIMEVLKALNAEGKTVVMITHEPDIAAHARRIVTIKDGRIESSREVRGEQLFEGGGAGR